ncbi:ABC transporter permease [Brachybacterium phenoliresistens]|uniref:ABC transporter permease n=1 Tax=Brachybacterium phenoliresistens TaxID=396014 RepID=Z9JRE4_9MICO|nr:sugar ABC transporter permease [Brachybacterium phenoliresistens]EWS80376.1 ABC transporter permease [Brachybacterium phenoliresistens]
MSTTTTTPRAGAAAPAPPPPAPRRRRRSGVERLERRWGPLMIAPVVLGFLLFTVGPMIASAVIGLTDWSIGGTPRFVGVDNFVEILTADPYFPISLRRTFLYAIIAVPGSMLVAFGIAVLLNQDVRGKGVLRTIFYLPVLVPAVASAVLWMWIYNPDFGLANAVLRAVGLPTSLWVFGEGSAVPSIALMAVWACGNMALIFVAGLQGVPRSLYEAAEVDGAGAWYKLRHVTIPYLSPIILYNLITGMIAAFQVFDQAFVMTGGGPNNATLFYVLNIYYAAFRDGRLGYASALAWILFVIVVIITVITFRIAQRGVFYEGGRAR